MDKNNEVSLLVGGEEYRVWESVQITATLMTLARGCVLKATRASRSDNLCKGIQPGLGAVIRIGSEIVLTGYVVRNDLSYTSNLISITIDIKSKTIDIEQCCIPLGKPHSWAGVSVVSVIKELAGHYGISVIDNGGEIWKKQLNISPHDHIGDAIVNEIKAHSLLITDDGFGRLVINPINTKKVANDTLENGKNILSGTRTNDASNLFKRYVVIGQGADPKSERSVPGNSLKAEAVNENFLRERWSVTEQSGNRTQAELKARADLLMTNSIGSADKFTYTVQGWRQSNGDLWEPGMTAKVKDTLLGFSGNLVIEKVIYSLDENGTTTTLTLKSADTWISTELPEEEKAKGTAVKKVIAKAKNGTSFLSKAGSGKL